MPKSRFSHTKDGVSVERVFPSGAWRISAIIGEHRVSEQYMGYSRAEAIEEFRAEHMPSKGLHRQNAASGRREARPYVGLVRGRASEREAFRSAVTPTASTHPRYGAVVGPFRTMRAAKLAAMAQMQGMARNVAEWERFAERREGQHQLALGAMKALSEPRVNGAKMQMPVYDWASAQKALGAKSSVRIGHNTTLRYNGGWWETPMRDVENDVIEVVLYSTPIVTYRMDGSITLNSGGHQTVTTKARINEVTPPWIDVYQKGGSWFVREPGVAGAVPFHDGMRVKHRL